MVGCAITWALELCLFLNGPFGCRDPHKLELPSLSCDSFKTGLGGKRSFCLPNSLKNVFRY